jgi:mannose/cellobiose epimerase-like protein (N-acyl-D-glucosamine 2-epimerase family)
MKLERYVSWLRDQALPFWLDDGRDPASGFFWERLDLAGRPDRAAALRVRVQARQIYVYAHAALARLAPRTASLEAASRALARLRAAAWAPDGRPGWVHSIALDGTVLDARRDLYDHAFMLHALAWMAKATGEPTYRDWIDETLAFVDHGLAAPAGGWAESDRQETPRRQNPHMHLLEASLALAETGAAPRQLARAGEIVGLFRTRFYDEETGSLREYFGPRWEVGPDCGSERLEPGHHMEWVWLLRRYARAGGAEVGGICDRLFANAERLGRDGATGFLVDEVDASGRCLIERRRLWPQTEYLKALLVQLEATGERRLHDAAGALVEALLASYLAGTVPGGWRDQFTLEGTPTTAFMPASSLYHLFVPAIEIARLEPSAAG